MSLNSTLENRTVLLSPEEISDRYIRYKAPSALIYGTTATVILCNYAYNFEQKQSTYSDRRINLIQFFMDQYNNCPNADCRRLVNIYQNGNLTKLWDAHQLDSIDLDLRVLPLMGAVFLATVPALIMACNETGHKSLCLRITSGLASTAVCGLAIHAIFGLYITSGTLGITSAVIGTVSVLAPTKVGQACSYIAQKASNCFNSFFRRGVSL